MIPDDKIDRPSLLVADAHTLLAEAIASAALRGGYSEAQVAGSLLDAYQLLNGSWSPSVLLIDFDLIRSNDLKGLEELTIRAPEVPIVVMYRESEEGQTNLILRVFVQGALGLVSKDRGVESMLRVLEVVQQGEAAIPRSLAFSVVEALRFGLPRMNEDVGLTARQRQVLALVARGLTDRQIAKQLAIGAPTVRSHLEAIFEKTQTTNRTAAARWASLHLGASENGSTAPASDPQSPDPMTSDISGK